jgi:hypothetical protein
LTYVYVWDSCNEGNHQEFSFCIYFHCASLELNYIVTTYDDNDEVEGDNKTIDGEDEIVYGDVVWLNLKWVAVHTPCNKLKRFLGIVRVASKH